MVTRQFPSSVRQRGFSMLEVAIGVLALSLMMSALLPMVTAQFKRSAAMKNASATAMAQNALVGYALMNGGLPPPYQFTGNTDAGRASIASPVVNADADKAGALPHDLLGTSVSGALAIPLLYDVHPMLRRDQDYEFNVKHYDGSSLVKAGTGGNMQQFCRNLNTLAAMETRFRADTDAAPNKITTDAVLPRTWRGALTASFNTPESNSTAVAAVVVRRNPYALRRYDRENNVMATPDAGGYAKSASYPRVYENPASGENESATSSTAAYAGNVSALSYNELRDALTKAGQCGSGPAMCTNNQLYVTIQNNVQTLLGGLIQGAMLQWGQAATGSSVTLYNTLAYGQTLAQCMDAVNLSPGGTDQKLALRVSTDVGDAEVEKIMVGSGGWLAGGVLSVPSKQSVVVRCSGTYTTTDPLTCTATN